MDSNRKRSFSPAGQPISKRTGVYDAVMVNVVPRGPSSFAASGRTKGWSVDGRRCGHFVKVIEKVEVGDLVWTLDESSQGLVKREVKSLFHHKTKSVMSVVLVTDQEEQQTIEATTEHPFWIEGKGWVATAELQTDDVVKRIDGGCQMRVLKVVNLGKVCDVFNFEVVDTHNYFVGSAGVLVHNESKLPGGDLSPFVVCKDLNEGKGVQINPVAVHNVNGFRMYLMEDGAAFRELHVSAKNDMVIDAQSKGKPSLDGNVTIRDSYEGKYLLISEDGKAGMAIGKGTVRDDLGYLGSVFGSPLRPPEIKAKSRLEMVTMQDVATGHYGATHLTAIDTILPALYEASNFTGVARVPFSHYKPIYFQDWDPSAFKKWNGGEPDIIHMVHTGEPVIPGSSKRLPFIHETDGSATEFALALLARQRIPSNFDVREISHADLATYHAELEGITPIDHQLPAHQPGPEDLSPTGTGGSFGSSNWWQNHWESASVAGAAGFTVGVASAVWGLGPIADGPTTSMFIGRTLANIAKTRMEAGNPDPSSRGYKAATAAFGLVSTVLMSGQAAAAALPLEYALGGTAPSWLHTAQAGFQGVGNGLLAATSGLAAVQSLVIAGGAIATNRNVLVPGKTNLLGWTFKASYATAAAATASLMFNSPLSTYLYGGSTAAGMALAATKATFLAAGTVGYGAVALKSNALGIGAVKYQVPIPGIGSVSAGKLGTYALAGYLALKLASGGLATTRAEEGMRSREYNRMNYSP